MRFILAALVLLFAATSMAQQVTPPRVSASPHVHHWWSMLAVVPSSAAPAKYDGRGEAASFDAALMEAVCLTMATSCWVVRMDGDLRSQIASGKADIAVGVEVVDLSTDRGVFSVSYGRVPPTAPDHRRGASLALLLKPGDPRLKALVDEALVRLRADGTIRRLAARLLPYPLQ